MKFINTLIFAGLIALLQSKTLKQEEQSFLANDAETNNETEQVAQPEAAKDNEDETEANNEEATD